MKLTIEKHELSPRFFSSMSLGETSYKYEVILTQRVLDTDGTKDGLRGDWIMRSHTDFQEAVGDIFGELWE